MPARVEVTFGEPLDFSEYFGRESEPGVLQEILRRSLKAVAALTCHPDFEPQIAGRHWKPTEEELEEAMAEAERRAQE